MEKINELPPRKKLTRIETVPADSPESHDTPKFREDRADRHVQKAKLLEKIETTAMMHKGPSHDDVALAIAKFQKAGGQITVLTNKESKPELGPANPTQRHADPLTGGVEEA